MILKRGGGYGTPLAVYDYPPRVPGYQDTTGKVLVDPTVVPGEKTGIFLVAGQSLVSNTCDGPLYVAGPKVHNFNIYDRKTYHAADPLLGCVNIFANFLGEMGDMLIAAGTFDRVILIPVGCASAGADLFAYSGIFNHRLTVALRCLPLFGAPLTAVLWGQGEQDAYVSTPPTQYTNWLREVISTVRGMGCNAPFFVARETLIFGNVSSVLQAAQASVIDNVTVFAGADMDSIPPTDRQPSDLTHLTAASRHTAAAKWHAVLSAHF